MYDISRMHREADRILRAQGNNSARQRMRSDTTLRPPKPPRGLILSTGEDIPRGQSLRARVWVVELSPGDINWNLLTECQKHATHGLYSQAMAGFVLWLALHYESVQQNLPQEIQDLRERAFSSGMHKRTPEIVANLAYGWSLFLEFSKDVGAISEDERQDFWERGWNALGQAAASQQHHQAASEPTQRFLEVVRAAIASGQAHVASPEGDAPKDARRWGWVESREEYDSWRFLGRRIGWIDGEDLYLEPNASYAAAQRMSRDSGESLAISS